MFEQLRYEVGGLGSQHGSSQGDVPKTSKREYVRVARRNPRRKPGIYWLAEKRIMESKNETSVMRCYEGDEFPLLKEISGSLAKQRALTPEGMGVQKKH